jgi:tetratricopeptide (TPR) repeat protein
MQRSGANLRLTLAILSLCSSLPVMAQNQPGTPQSASVNNTLRQLVGQSPGHAISYYNLALEAYQKGALESAIIFFRRATDLDPNLSDAQYNLGVLYQSQKRAKEAIPRFEEVLRVKPTDADAHYQLGLALMDMGRAADAKTHFAAIAPNSQHFADAHKAHPDVRCPACWRHYSDSHIFTHSPASGSTATASAACACWLQPIAAGGFV